MLVQGILCVFLLLYFYSFGILFKKIFPESPELNSYYLLSGFLTVSFIGLVTAFFFPLNIYYEIVLISISLVISIIHTHKIKSFLLSFKDLDKEFYLIIFIGLLIAITYPFILDHFGYYIPTVKWLDFTGYQKGISNFSWVLVQNSLWHILQASINETLDISYRLNFILFIVYNIYVFEKRDFKLLIFNLLFILFINTPSPDLPIFVFSIVLINEYVKVKNKADYFLFISTFLVLIKSIAIILPFYFLYECIKNKNYKFDIKIIGILTLTVLFFLKNIVTSANPIFPFVYGNFLNLDWSSPNIFYQISSQYGRFIPLKERFSYKEVIEMNSLKYLKNIFISFHLRSIILSVEIVITLLLFFCSLIYKRFYQFRILSFFLILKTLIIVITSPQFRFLLDVLILDLLIILIVYQFKKLNFRKWSIFLLIMILFVFNLSGVLKSNINSIATFTFIEPLKFENLLFPSNYEKVRYRKERLGNLDFNYSPYYIFMYNGDVPTLGGSDLTDILYNSNYLPQLINDKDLKEGFKSEKLNEDKKIVIEEILNNK